MNNILFFIFLLFISSPIYAESYKQGHKSEDGMIYLFQEPIEIYWNNWTGKSLHEDKIYISGEGKTVNFDGILNLNCESESGYTWVAVNNFNEQISKEYEFTDIVPIQVISATFEEFCNRN